MSTRLMVCRALSRAGRKMPLGFLPLALLLSVGLEARAQSEAAPPSGGEALAAGGEPAARESSADEATEKAAAPAGTTPSASPAPPPAEGSQEGAGSGAKNTVSVPTTTSAEAAQKEKSTSFVPMHHFELADRRVYLGKRLTLTPLGDTATGTAVSATLLGATLLYPCDKADPRCVTGWSSFDLTQSIQRFANGHDPYLDLPSQLDIEDQLPVRRARPAEFFSGRTAWLCLLTNPPQAVDRTGDPCSTLPGYSRSEPIRLELASRLVAVILGFSAVVCLAGLTYLLTTRGQRKTVRDLVSGRHDAATGSFFSLWDKPLMQIAVTQSNTLSLSICQVLAWTLLVLFGQLYVWNLTDQFVTVTSEVLVLLGLGGATALSSRLSTSGRSSIPSAYLTLVQAPGRQPTFADLVTVGGRPNIFKLQMLFFTATSLLMVLNELLQSCRFPQLPSEYLSLMGISSGTYVLNDWMQRSGWTDLEKSIRVMDRHSMNLTGRLPRTASDIRALLTTGKDDATRDQVLRDFEELLKRLRDYFAEDAEDASLNAQSRKTEALFGVHESDATVVRVEAKVPPASNGGPVQTVVAVQTSVASADAGSAADSGMGAGPANPGAANPAAVGLAPDEPNSPSRSGNE